MPFYDYECERCHCVFERKQRFDEEPVAVCECGGKARRVLHSVPIIFKGSGFYVTDYKQGSTGEVSKTTKEPAKEPAAATEAKSSPAAETKPSTVETKPSETGPATKT